MIRLIENRIKMHGYRLDKHLPISEFDEKVRCCSLIPSIAERAKDCGGFVVDIPGYEQPMEMIMIKELTV